jgi:hypothetical protein
VGVIRDIHKAVIMVLATAYPTTEINMESVDEGFARPSFFPVLEDPVMDSPDPLTQTVRATVRVYYFPPTLDNNMVALETMGEALEALFRNSLAVGSPATFANVEEIYIDIVDGVLNVSFRVEMMYALADTDTSELMTDLIYEQEVQ